MEKAWLEQLKEGKCLDERSLKDLCNKVKEILVEESNLQPVSAPVIVCGDIHGQFYDLLELFNIGGEIPNNRYLFMGDYVDRGFNSVETISLLLTLKLLYPGHITLLRGNHETRYISMQYGLYSEISKKYGNVNAWKYICEVFDFLPMAALIEGKIFCVHGGLSPFIPCIDQIRKYDRFKELETDSPLGDLCWSDPDEEIEHWEKSQRGAGWIFGARVVKEFNHINNLELVCRSHQLVMEGFKYYFDESMLNVWSAPNYSYRMRNVASILKISETLSRTIELFRDDPRSKKSIPPKEIVPYFL